MMTRCLRSPTRFHATYPFGTRPLPAGGHLLAIAFLLTSVSAAWAEPAATATSAKPTTTEGAADVATDETSQAKKTDSKETKGKKGKAARASVAVIELKGGYPEAADAPGLFGEMVESLSAAVGRLDKAANDEAVVGVLLKINSPQIRWGKLNEFQQAIGRVRAKGKEVIAYLDSAMTVDYLLAAACDRIVMPESGVAILVGLRAEVSFYKNLFDMLSIQPDVLKIGEFKSAGEPYSRTEMSPEFRLEMEELLDDLFAQIVSSVAKGRKLTEAQVKTLIDAGPYTATDALKAGLIDQLGYESEVPGLFRAADSSEAPKLLKSYGRKKIDTDFSGLNGLVNMMNLLAGVEPQSRKSTTPKIAVIHATGAIMPGSSSSDFLGSETLGSDTIIKAIHQARDDATVKAIVLRVDSPGGSALASDLMWRELEQVKKPVIASMGDVAASGGYYISMGADRIFAEPGTITGSIGVVMAKVALEKFYEKIGITTTVIQRGKNSGVLSVSSVFSETERAAMMRMLHEIYGQFTTKAAAGRNMDVEKLEKLARGRVYTGRMAKELNLIDEVGTLADAIAYAKTAAKLSPDEKVEKLTLPRPVSPFEQLFGPLGTDAELNESRAATLADALIGQLLSRIAVQKLPETLLDAAKAANLALPLEREPAVMVMPFQLRIR